MEVPTITASKKQLIRVLTHIYKQHQHEERKKYTNTSLDLKQRYGVYVPATEIKRKKMLLEGDIDDPYNSDDEKVKLVSEIGPGAALHKPTTPASKKKRERETNDACTTEDGGGDPILRQTMPMILQQFSTLNQQVGQLIRMLEPKRAEIAAAVKLVSNSNKKAKLNEETANTNSLSTSSASASSISSSTSASLSSSSSLTSSTSKPTTSKSTPTSKQTASSSKPATTTAKLVDELKDYEQKARRTRKPNPRYVDPEAEMQELDSGDQSYETNDLVTQPVDEDE